MHTWLTSPTASRAISAELERRDFERWLWAVSPTWSWQWPHLAYIRAALNEVTAGHITHLMIMMPPRHGKSEMVTIRYPVWLLERDPSLSVIIGAYNQQLANRFSRRARWIARQRLELDEDRQAVQEWHTRAGGGLRAVGVGAGITGTGGHVIIIDDPIKSREEANSAPCRDRVWEWYINDVYTRREPGAVVIMIVTRWHEDDLPGRALANDAAGLWQVISLPAEAEEDDPLGRPFGAALCPDRFDLSALAQIKAVLGNNYYALYQQRPQPIMGGMFKRDRLEIRDGSPREADRMRYWDKAATVGGSYTVGVLLAHSRRDGAWFVEDVIRGQWTVGERENIIRQAAILDKQRYGDVTIGLEQEPGSGGKESAHATIRNLAGFSVVADRPSGDKITRAEPFAAQVDGGNVSIVKGAWNAAYLEELAAFPTGAHDDQVDASSGAFNRLVELRKSKQTRFLR